MATMTTFAGSGAIAAADYRAIKWTGKTKGGGSVVIEFTKAINMGNIDWTFAEKDDTVAQVVFTSVYTNKDVMASSPAEAWTVKFTPGSTDSASGNIMLGAGVLSIDSTDVALTRGGGSFSVEREFREINADGDRGPVEDRIVIDGSRATLTLNALTFIKDMNKLYPAVTATTSTT